jgi:hypothetical protein
MNTQHDIANDVRGMQILAGVLMLGLAVFAGIVLLVSDGKPDDPLVALVMAVMVIGEVPVFFILPPQQLKREQGELFDAKKELQRYSGAMLLRYALCNGGGFANLIAYLVAGQWWSLAIAGGLWLVMLAMFPTRTKVEHWLENRRIEAGMDFNRSDFIEERR